MRILILALIVLATTGCASFPGDTLRPNIENVTNTSFRFEFIAEGNLKKNGKKVYALAYPLGDLCIVKVDPRFYTHDILGHELRHCLEGFWHGKGS